MSSEITVKIQSLLWWVSSIAVSVLCCSVLFVFFASYMMDIKATVQNNDARIAVLEARQERLFSEVEALQKKGTPVTTQPVVAPMVAPTTDAAPPVTVPAAPEPAVTPAQK